MFVRRSCMFLRRRAAPFGPPYRVSHKCYAFPRRSCGVSTEKMRVSTEKLHICTEKRLSVTEQRQYSTEKFDFHGITTRLYGEGARFYGEGLALMGHRRFQPGLTINIALTKLSPGSNCSCNHDAISTRLTGLKLSPG